MSPSHTHLLTFDLLSVSPTRSKYRPQSTEPQTDGLSLSTTADGSQPNVRKLCDTPPPAPQAHTHNLAYYDNIICQVRPQLRPFFPLFPLVCLSSSLFSLCFAVFSSCFHHNVFTLCQPQLYVEVFLYCQIFVCFSRCHQYCGYLSARRSCAPTAKKTKKTSSPGCPVETWL